MKPTKIELLSPKKINPLLMKQVTSADAFEGMSRNLNPEGLYSTEIFGRVSKKERNEKEGHIDLGISIFNPTYFKTTIALKGLYLGIIKGTEYALWDSVEKDFIKSNLLEGETGYSFFMRHFIELSPKLNKSHKRKQRIKLFDENKEISKTTKFPVIPAGIRDIEFQPDGGVMEQEINELYRKLIFKSKSLTNVPEREFDNAIYDNTRYGIQSGVQDIDQHLFDILNGKGGMLQSKVGKRGLVNSTRNVIVARRVSRDNLFEESGVGINSTDIGLFQGLMMYIYPCTHAMINGFLNDVFTGGLTNARLINPKTLETEYVDVTSEVVEKWTTPEGINKLFNGFKNFHLRHKPIMINGHYLGLVYDDGERVNLLHDIDDLKEGFDKKYVTPLTYIELYYLTCHNSIVSNLSQQTRYPITGIGSIYPSYVNLLTTSDGKKRKVLNEFWEEDYTCMCYPNKRENGKYRYYDAMSPDISRYEGMGADNDGRLNIN